MLSKPISVTLALGTDSYQQGLPAALLRRAVLCRVLRFGPDLEILDPNATGSLEMVKRLPAYGMTNRILWGIWRRLPGTGYSQLPRIASTWLADRLASKYVPPASVFHGRVGICLACLRVAKRQGAMTVMENPTLHLQQWQDEVITDCRLFGINPHYADALLPLPLIRRARSEYEECDRILVLSSVARQSFERFDLAAKVVVTWPGVDHVFFTPAPKPSPPRLFRACYVGRVEVAKGVGYLLKAWEQLRLHEAELLLVGDVRPEMESLLRNYAREDVRATGALPPQQVADHYRESSVLVHPSANEGFGLVLLEAMAAGLPVIASERSGARDCVTEGKDGFLVPARNVDALAERILWCYEHPDETMTMGRAARAKIEERFTLSHYEERQVAMYRSLVT